MRFGFRDFAKSVFVRREVGIEDKALQSLFVKRRKFGFDEGKLGEDFGKQRHYFRVCGRVFRNAKILVVAKMRVDKNLFQSTRNGVGKLETSKQIRFVLKLALEYGEIVVPVGSFYVVKFLFPRFVGGENVRRTPF